MRGVDLFCGVGGLSAGLSEAGIDIVAAYDNWPLAVETYNSNLPSHAEVLDLSDVDRAANAVASHKPDIIVGGPPCQDFSSAGRRVNGDHAALTTAYARIVARCAPEFVLMENVPLARKSAAYAFLRSTLEGQGYRFAEVMLDASRCGAPQLRRRFFSLGVRRNGKAVCESFVSWTEESQTPNRLTVKEYMGDEIDIEYYYRHARNYSRRAVFSVHEPSPTVRGVNRPVPPNYQGNHLDSASPSTVRPLTSWERSRVQTFPKDWHWGSVGDRNADVETLIGNAVPVQLAAFVGAGIQHAAA